MEQSLFKSLAEVASRINASGDLDQTLQDLLEAVCRQRPWSAGGIMSVDAERGYAQTIARHDPDGLGGNLETLWPLAESPTRVAIERNEPVIIRDAQLSQEFPGYHREAIAHGYRGVIVLPMDYRNAAGHRILLSVRSREAVDVTPDELAFLQFVVHLGQIAMDKARSLAEEQAFGERLSGALSAHGSLLDQVLADDSVSAAARMVASLLPDPPVIVDLMARRVMSERSPLPTLIEDKAWLTAIAGELGPQFLEIATTRPSGRHRFDGQELTLFIGGHTVKAPAIVCPLMVDQTRVGALIVFSPAPGEGDLDHLLLDSARFGLSVQMMRSYVAFVTEARNLEELFADLLDGTRPLADVVERAERLNIDLAQPARMIALTPARKLAATAALDLRRELSHVLGRLDGRATLAWRGGTLVALCPIDRKQEDALPVMIQRMIAEVKLATGALPIAVLSKPCRRPTDYLPAWRDCDRLHTLAQRFGRTGLVEAANFGPFPVLMSAVDSGEMLGFVDRLIGPMARHDESFGTAYIRTLAAFLDQGCRSQPCADALGIHVTTLRYRLERLKDLFGVATETPEQRFALQLALQFQQILAPVHGDPGQSLPAASSGS